jgi:hypothetical protein
LGELRELPFVHSRHPLPARLGRWSDPWVARVVAITEGDDVRPILVDPFAHLIGSTDGPVTGDDDIDVSRDVVKQLQGGEIIVDRVSGAPQVEHRNEDVREHVAGDENAAFLDQQRRVPRSMRLMLDDQDLRPVPGNCMNPLSWANTPPATCLSMAGSCRCRLPTTNHRFGIQSAQ